MAKVEIHPAAAGGLGPIGLKNPPIDPDRSLYLDSTAGDAPVTSTWAQIKAFLKLYFDTLYAAIGLAHARLHSITSILDHSSAATPGKILKADANGLPIDATNTDADVADAVSKKHTQGTDTALGAVGTKNPPIDADKALYRDSAAGDALVTSTWAQVKAFLKTYLDTVYGAIALAHTRLHSITSALDHSSAATPGKMLKADANGLPVDATNTDAEVADAVTKKHTQGTDTALGAVGVKNPPIDADKSLYRDSAAGDVLVTSTWTQIKAFFKTYFDTLYGPLASAHARLHSITSALDHSSGATPGQILKANANGLPVDAANTDAQVAATVGLAHAQGTDTALGAVGTKNPPIDADKALYRDSAAGDALVTSTWTQVKAFLKTYFDTMYIKHSLSTAVNDFLVSSVAGVFAKKTLAEVKTILGLGTAAYTAATDYVTHALATAANDFLVASGSGAFVKKTLAEVKTLLNWAADIATHAGLTTGVHSFNKTCRLWNNATQSIPNVTATAVTFNTEKWDTDGMHSLVSNTHLVTIQTAGKYMVVASIEFEQNATGNRQIYIYKNGTELQIYGIDWAPRSDAKTLLSVFCFADLAVNDTIQLKVYQSSGGSLNIATVDPYVPQLSVTRIP